MAAAKPFVCVSWADTVSISLQNCTDGTRLQNEYGRQGQGRYFGLVRATQKTLILLYSLLCLIFVH